MFQILPISSIIVHRDERQRRELVDLESLAESIRLRGVLNPIIIDQDNILVAGERRLEASRLAGLTEIPTRQFSSLDPITAQIIELEENIKRRDLSWQDECAAVVRYHRMRALQTADHTITATANELAISEKKVRDALLILKEIEDGNELVIKAEAYSTARNLAERRAERAAAAAADNITATVLGTLGLSNDVRESISVKAPALLERSIAPILNADFAEWIETYTGPKFNFIHCDFPYGVNADKHKQGAAKFFRGYADSPDVYWSLVADLDRFTQAHVSESAHLMFWFSLDYYQDTLLALTQIGWRVNPFPLIWYKSDNTGILPDPDRGPRRIYETAFLASRGDRKIVQPVGNVFPHGVESDRIHMSQKPRPMLSHFFRMFVDDSSVMIDPTCGSGNAVLAAEEMGAKSVLGLEKDAEFYLRAKEQWK